LDDVDVDVDVVRIARRFRDMAGEWGGSEKTELELRKREAGLIKQARM